MIRVNISTRSNYNQEVEVTAQIDIIIRVFAKIASWPKLVGDSQLYVLVFVLLLVSGDFV